ncbi:hypothetical protein DRH29_04390 [candidate division Kazan bacterium]|uniref:Uncharacterized protein n=1 Tax=candidate division Kazan bacterium TaxID=2202143 RepID=A0A420ZBM7_UNCK3|nr:MAG: hypothetical protein DRH29_04390 [candidate division Kazan bacterium]
MSAIELQHLFEEALSRLARGDFNSFIGSASRFANMFGLDLDPSIYFYKSSLLERSVGSSALTRIEFSNYVLGQVLLFRDEMALEAYRLKAEALKAAYQVMFHVVERLEDLFHSSILRIVSFWILRDIRVGEAFVRAETTEEFSMLGSILAKCLLCKIPLEEISCLIEDAFQVYGCGQALKHASAIRKMDYVKLLEKCRARFKTNYLKLNAVVSPRIGRVEETFEEEVKLSYELHRLWYMWLEEKPNRLPAPFFIIPKAYWSSGTLPRRGSITVRPFRFPPFAVKGRTVLNTLFGVLGSGKTVFLNSMAVYRLDRGGFGLRLEIDHHRRLQAQLMATPLHRDHPAYDYVVNVEKLRPRPVDVISLVIVRKDSDLKYAKPPLRIDRIVYVDNPGAFHLGPLWDKLYKPGRLICLKFVNMHVTGRAYTSLLKSFLEFRAERRGQPMFVQIEEAMMGASAKVSMMYSRSMLISAEEVEMLVQGLRGLGLSSELSSQRPSYIIVSARGQASNIFAGHMAPQDVEAVFEGLPEKGDFEIAKRIVNDGTISFNDNFKWFLWIDKTSGEVRFVRSVMPPCGAEISDMNPAEIFEEYNLIADGWNRVKRLTSEPLPEHEEFLPERELERRQKARTSAKRRDEEVVITL